MKKITKKMLKEATGERGCLNKAQILVLGYKNFFKGWEKRLVNTYYEDYQVEKFMSLANLHISDNGLYKKILREETDKIKVEKYKKLTLEEDKYADSRWVALRKRVLERDKYTCKLCGRKNSIMNVHHSKYIGKHIWDTPMEYLITLCKNCHERFHNIK